ncbi:helix-turn-helix domain-containing protein [Streptomyces virginiae]|uniref:XRE family transcriptional regulator n=1 Tax=Streptomyces virginiae TaxID=1961 RepID=UPI0036524686
MSDQKAIPLFRLVSRDLLATLMKRTGTGAAMSVRELASEAEIPRSTVGNLLTGDQESVAYPTACAIAASIGVDVLILFTPTGRAMRQSGRLRLKAAG